MAVSYQAPVVTADALRVDDFGLSIGPVSVGLPRARTADDVYRRYLDLVGLLRRRSDERIVAPVADLDALARATGVDRHVVARRLDVLQLPTTSPGVRRPRPSVPTRGTRP